MNLYLISQSVNNDYDTYDSAVVVASSKKIARNIHPGGSLYDKNQTRCWTTVDRVEVELIGTAKKGSKEGTVICSSFNAG